MLKDLAPRTALGDSTFLLLGRAGSCYGFAAEVTFDDGAVSSLVSASLRLFKLMLFIFFFGMLFAPCDCKCGLSVIPLRTKSF